jgi:hypothetical protein
MEDFDFKTPWDFGNKESWGKVFFVLESFEGLEDFRLIFGIP